MRLPRGSLLRRPPLRPALFSLYLLFVTLGAYRDISLTSRVAGIGPSIVLVAALALLFVFLRY